MTPPKRRIATLFIDGKPAKILGTIPGWIVVQIGTARPICIPLATFEGRTERG